MSIPSWPPEPEETEPSPAPSLTAAEITETAMALLAYSMDVDGVSIDFARGVLALFKALTAPGSSM